MGVTISRWPLDEAAAKRVWEKRVAQELAFDAKGIDAEVRFPPGISEAVVNQATTPSVFIPRVRRAPRGV